MGGIWMSSEEKQMRYKFVVRETTIQVPRSGVLKKERVTNIGLLDRITGFIAPHPLSHFIVNKFENLSNTSLNPAREIVKFLNFIFERVEERHIDYLQMYNNGLYELRLIHGSQYICHLTDKEVSRKHVKRVEHYLTAFYKYLQDNQLVKEDFKIEQVVIHKSESYTKKITLSPFLRSYLNTRYPKRDIDNNLIKLKDFGGNRYNLVRELINIARDVQPEIAFGICLQIWGGLRRGEVVNLTKTSLGPSHHFGLRNATVDIKDRQIALFPHLKDTKKEQVKRPRLQIVFPSELLNEVYEEHMKALSKMKLKNKNALFVNKWGYPLSGSSYEYKFKKVKRVLLERLENTEGRLEDYQTLTSGYWGTHIGRGIFTNFLLDMGMTPQEIMLLRGDKGINTSLEYFCKRNAIKNFNKAMEQFSQKETQIEAIDYNKIEKNWNQGLFYRGG